jgi:predicted amidophosphoribosyltransferase
MGSRCVSCERPKDRAGDFCRECWFRLPEATRRAFESGQASVKRVAACSRERNRSVRAFGGGRKS